MRREDNKGVGELRLKRQILSIEGDKKWRVSHDLIALRIRRQGEECGIQNLAQLSIKW